MMTMGWERDGFEGDGLGMSLKDRATVGVVVDMDRTDHGCPHRGNARRRELLVTAAIFDPGYKWWEGLKKGGKWRVGVGKRKRECGVR